MEKFDYPDSVQKSCMEDLHGVSVQTWERCNAQRIEEQKLASMITEKLNR